MIKVEHLSKTYEYKKNVVHALNDVSFVVEKKDIYGIIGLSGAGKSTLIRCINLLEKPTSGRVIVDGDDMMSLSNKQLLLKRRKIGMIFQNFNLLMQRNILSNVCFPMEIIGINKEEAKKKALEFLNIVGLQDKALAYPAQLSGGQKQRVAIARILALQPDVILCDEATSALDPETTKSILNLIKEINIKYGITVIVITHEMNVIQEICNKCVVLEDGKIVEENTVEELFKNPKTSAAKRLIYQTNTNVKSVKGGKIIRIVFGETNTQEPIIANLILEFSQPVNILESSITSVGGIFRGQMMIELPNDLTMSNKMIEYLKANKAISVEEVKDNG